MSQENQLFSWVQLTHLQIRRPISSAQQALVIFKACSKLVWLSINFKLPQGPAYESHEPPVILHDLVSIFIGSESCCFSFVIGSISAPSLREMCVASTQTLPRDGKSLLHFLTRSSCALERLELGGPFVSCDIIPLLSHRCCSLLTSLIIRDFPALDRDFSPIVDDEILQRLTLHRDDSLCPHLNLLGLRSILPSQQSAMQSMIESRICPKASPTLYKRLRYLWVQGQDFDWKPLDEVLKTSEMAYSLNCQWNGRRGSASGWPEGETRLVRGSQLCYTAISNSEMRIIGIAYRYLNMF